MRVLERDEARDREVRVVGLYRAADVVHAERPVGRGGQHTRVDAADGRAAALLVQIHVRAVADDVLGAALGAVGHETDEVRHRPGRHEQRRLLREELRNATLEHADRRVLSEDVVADLGGRHGSAHRGGRRGDRVAPQVHARCGGCEAARAARGSRLDARGGRLDSRTQQHFCRAGRSVVALFGNFGIVSTVNAPFRANATNGVPTTPRDPRRQCTRFRHDDRKVH